MSCHWIRFASIALLLPLSAAWVSGCGSDGSSNPPVGGAGGSAKPAQSAGQSGSATAVHGGAGGATASTNVRNVSIRFKPELLGADFACGRQYADVGATHISVEPADFRFFVQDLRLIDKSGKEVAVALDERAPWQSQGVSLLDFEDQTGACSQGNPETNDRITGTVPQGEYQGVVFSNGVPEQLNHEDPLKHPAPLQFTDLTWGWLGGFKFFVSELHAVAAYEPDGGEPGAGLLHVGSRDCSGDRNVSITCAQLNRNEIRLDNFDPDANVIAADIGQVFANTDLRLDAQCHSAGDYCAPMFEQVGVDWATGKSMSAQNIYRVK